MSDLFTFFTSLDELIQIIYQGSARFVVLSSVADEHWTVHVGLTGDRGRWWRGLWTDKDVRDTVGQNISSILMEFFVENLANAFVQGNVTVGDWSPTKGAAIKLIIGTTSKTPIQIPLLELSSEEAATYATKVFAEIALQAQSRRCRLHPSALAPSADSAELKGSTTNARSSESKHMHREPTPVIKLGTKQTSPQPSKEKDKGKDKEVDINTANASKKRKAKLEEAEEEIESLKVELAKSKQKQNALMSAPAKLITKTGAAAVPRKKGTSLANPTKKARKYQALEFESDEE